MSEFVDARDVYLRADAKLEPLCCRWYAWPHLLPPVQHSINLVFRQIPLLQSFVSDPGLHASLSADSENYCAPVMQLDPSLVTAVEALISETLSSCDSLVRFAADFRGFGQRVHAVAIGQCLDEYYGTLPQSLCGLTEMTYDLNNHPHINIVEALAYRGELNNEHTQEISLSSCPDIERRFFLNTPRIEVKDSVDFKLPFSDPRLDILGAARTNAVPFNQLVDALRVPTHNRARFRKYFSPTQHARKTPEYNGDAIRVRYFGHACVLLQTRNVSILIDPLLTSERYEGEGHLTITDLPDKIDYVFLTHNHHDHCVPETLLQLRWKVGEVLIPRNNPSSIADPSMKLILNSLGFSNVRTLDSMERITIPGGEILSLPFLGEHAGLDIFAKQGMYLTLNGKKFFLLADSACVDRELYRRVIDVTGKIDVLFIGMECHGAPLTWLYGPYLPDQISRRADESRRLSGSNSEQAWAIAQECGCTAAFVYAMAMEPWVRHLSGLAYASDSKQIVESNKFVDTCRAASIRAKRLFGCEEMTF